MTKELVRIRRLVAPHKPGRGKRYAADVRCAVVRWARRRREEGAIWAAVANEVGLRFETVRGWCESLDESTASIVAAAGTTVFLVRPLPGSRYSQRTPIVTAFRWGSRADLSRWAGSRCS